MNYIGDIKDTLEAALGDCPDDLLRMYTLLVLTTGENTTLENVHDAWACWRDATRPYHKSLVPFEELSPDVQALDQKYADAIRKAAAQTGGAS